jgi:hypothetical protein
MNRHSLIALGAVVLIAAAGAYALSSTGKRNVAPVAAQPARSPALTPEEAKSVVSVQVLPEDKVAKAEEPPPPPASDVPARPIICNLLLTIPPKFNKGCEQKVP